MNVLMRWFYDVTQVGPAFCGAGIRARLSKQPLVKVPLPQGGVATVRPRNSDFGTLRSVFVYGDYRIPSERCRSDIEKRYEAILARGKVPVIIDAGANIGAATLWFKQAYPKAAVLAVEPDPATCAVARENFGGLADVTLFEAAIGGQPGNVVMVPFGDFAWGVQTERSEHGTAVVTIRELMSHVPNGELFIAKIDIEGFEADLFDGDVEWMDEVFAVFIEPHDWMLPDQRTSHAFQREFGKRDFAIYMVGENLLYVRRGQDGAA